ncbi:MAG TPA: glycosyltransferase [Verrucomicrobiae bacterium]|nr:glycosyltransferase [Verrucomicrobiae bacterium]
MRVRILMITYNRPGYTELALRRLCETAPEYAGITVWDNNSNAELRAVLKQFESHPRIEKIIYNPTNDRLHGPTTWFWNNAGDAEFLCKVDDDCLMPPNWCETLEAAHRDIPEAGILGCWRFLDEDFDEKLASRKIQQFGQHRILRNCWVEGSGYLMKRAVLDKIGNLLPKESFTSYCVRAAANGFINGWYFPFLYQEHMDDPRVPSSGIRTEEDFQRLRPLSANTFKIENRAQWIERLKYSAWVLQACSYDPRHYSGWRYQARKLLSRVTGKRIVARA